MAHERKPNFFIRSRRLRNVQFSKTNFKEQVGNPNRNTRKITTTARQMSLRIAPLHKDALHKSQEQIVQKLFLGIFAYPKQNPRERNQENRYETPFNSAKILGLLSNTWICWRVNLHIWIVSGRAAIPCPPNVDGGHDRRSSKKKPEDHLISFHRPNIFSH